MKTKTVPLLAVLLVTSTAIVLAQTPIKYSHFIKTVTAADPPEAITSTNLRCSSVTLLGIKAARTPNVGIVYVGWTSNNNAQFFPVAIDGEIVINAGEGRTINLAEIYIDVLNAGDGVGVIYR